MQVFAHDPKGQINLRVLRRQNEAAIKTYAPVNEGRPIHEYKLVGRYGSVEHRTLHEKCLPNWEASPMHPLLDTTNGEYCTSVVKGQEIKMATARCASCGKLRDPKRAKEILAARQEKFERMKRENEWWGMQLIQTCRFIEENDTRNKKLAEMNRRVKIRVHFYNTMDEYWVVTTDGKKGPKLSRKAVIALARSEYGMMELDFKPHHKNWVEWRESDFSPQALRKETLDNMFNLSSINEANGPDDDLDEDLEDDDLEDTDFDADEGEDDLDDYDEDDDEDDDEFGPEEDDYDEDDEDEDDDFEDEDEDDEDFE